MASHLVTDFQGGIAKERVSRFQVSRGVQLCFSSYHLEVNPSCSRYIHIEIVKCLCKWHVKILLDTPKRILYHHRHSMTISFKR